MPPPPNILLITTDQQRRDTLSCLGAPIGRTPHLDALAARGVVFGRCMIQNPVCIPSRACLQTGRYTWQHGVRYMENVIDTTPGLPPWECTFHERLRRAGYHTAAFGKIHMMPERGFDTMQVTGGKGARWTQSSGLPIGPGPLGPQYAAWLEAREPGGYERIYEARRHPDYKQHLTAIPFPLSAELHPDTWIGGNTTDFIANPPAEPWFVQCGFTGPHGPLDVPPEYLGRYEPDDMPVPHGWDADLSAHFPYRHGSRPRPPEELARARRFTAYYHGLMDLLDEQVGRIMATLDRLGLWDNTLVMFVSDHGEMRGDFGAYGKGNFYDPVANVPCLVVPPGGAPPTRRSDVIEMFDLAPTALDYAGLPVPPHMAARSLRPQIETGAPGRAVAFGDYVTNDRRTACAYCRTARYKLVLWTTDGERFGELFDLQEDPGELTNRYEDPALAGVRRELTEMILQRRLQVDAPPPRDEWEDA
ncbi:MAG: sulfatase-like hydrolase/transferase [Armatimonadetes bacterium]|nr:sulfatase-like hydrolase/transferase [Armatimonadota bacterium]